MNLKDLSTVLLIEVIDDSSEDYFQNMQHTNFSYAALNRECGSEDVFEELHEKATCREFLGDFVTYSMLDKDVTYNYGLQLEHGVRWGRKETLLSVDMEDIERFNFLFNFGILNKLEEEINIEPTKVYKTSGKSLVLVGSSFWVKSPLTISIYSMILRGLVYATNATSFEDHLYKLSILDYRHNSLPSDVNYAIDICASKVDLIHLLKNIDEVLGSSPITGSCDEFVASRNKIISEDGLEYTFSRDLQHSYHGICTFINLLLCKSGIKHSYCKPTHTHWEWADNYYKILRKSGI